MELHGSLNMIGYGLAAIGSAIGVGLIFACLLYTSPSPRD